MAYLYICLIDTRFKRNSHRSWDPRTNLGRCPVLNSIASNLTQNKTEINQNITKSVKEAVTIVGHNLTVTESETTTSARKPEAAIGALNEDFSATIVNVDTSIISTRGPLGALTISQGL